MEIERKFLIKKLPSQLEQYPHHTIEQGYLCTDPVVRVRRRDQDYFLTYKSRGKMVREEYDLPLTAEAYAHLIEKADGFLITKTRYLIGLDQQGDPCLPSRDQSPSFSDDTLSPRQLSCTGLTVELDLFTSPGTLIMAEVEFQTEEQAQSFQPPSWFGEEVTFDKRYHNSYMSRCGIQVRPVPEAEEGSR